MIVRKQADREKTKDDEERRRLRIVKRNNYGNATEGACVLSKPSLPRVNYTAEEGDMRKRMKVRKLHQKKNAK